MFLGSGLYLPPQLSHFGKGNLISPGSGGATQKVCNVPQLIHAWISGSFIFMRTLSLETWRILAPKSSRYYSFSFPKNTYYFAKYQILVLFFAVISKIKWRHLSAAIGFILPMLPKRWPGSSLVPRSYCAVRLGRPMWKGRLAIRCQKFLMSKSKVFLSRSCQGRIDDHLTVQGKYKANTPLIYFSSFAVFVSPFEDFFARRFNST